MRCCQGALHASHPVRGCSRNVDKVSRLEISSLCHFLVQRSHPSLGHVARLQPGDFVDERLHIAEVTTFAACILFVIICFGRFGSCLLTSSASRSGCGGRCSSSSSSSFFCWLCHPGLLAAEESARNVVFEHLPRCPILVRNPRSEEMLSSNSQGCQESMCIVEYVISRSFSCVLHRGATVVPCQDLLQANLLNDQGNGREAFSEIVDVNRVVDDQVRLGSSHRREDQARAITQSYAHRGELQSLNVLCLPRLPAHAYSGRAN
mmetsp:Transcript_29269/g.63507  ORF Transcript_29269/g.63507 Transcript_29269/m.63507 type:complete len:263 (-) Transcript_29269:596-1384(-)